MKKFLTIFLALFISFSAACYADIVTTISMDDSDIKIKVVHPEGWDNKEMKDLDMYFQDPQDPGRQIGFHFYYDPEFSLSSFNDVIPYANFVMELLKLSGPHNTSMSFKKDGSTYAFTAKDSENRDIYCVIYMNKIEGVYVYASISTSLKSVDNAIDDLETFVNKKLYWEKPSK